MGSGDNISVPSTVDHRKFSAGDESSKLVPPEEPSSSSDNLPQLDSSAESSKNQPNPPTDCSFSKDPPQFAAGPTDTADHESSPTQPEPDPAAIVVDRPTEQQIEYFLRNRSRSEGSILHSPKKGALKKNGDHSGDVKQKRRVSFADNNGFALEQIRYLEQASKTTIEEFFQDFLVDLDDHQFFKTDSHANRAHCALTNRRFVPYFSLPWAGMGNQKLLYAALEDRKICLEQVIINSPWKITGTILVKNLSFDKRVFVRQTLDKWKTHKDLDCDFVCSLNSSIDRFHFDVRLPFKLAAGTRMEMALCYEMTDRGGAQHWDNNLDCNYSFWYNDKV